MAAVLFVDLDRFKRVNDLHGHGVGDELLIAVAQRLSAVLRSGDTLARMSGDEFVILCEDVESSAHVDTIASRVGAAISTPFNLLSMEIEITASVGIAFMGPGDQLSEELLRDADTAMYQAKRKGVAGTRSSTCASSISPTNAPTWNATCEAQHYAKSCTPTTNRSSQRATGASRASKPSCAGRTRLGDW